MNSKQRIQMLEDDLDREIEFSQEMLAHAAEILYYFGECMVKHYRASSCRSRERSEASVEREFVLDFVRNKSKGESPELILLREEAISHYFYMQAYAAVKTSAPEDRETIKELMIEGLLRRGTADWLEGLLSMDSNGGMVIRE